MLSGCGSLVAVISTFLLVVLVAGLRLGILLPVLTADIGVLVPTRICDCGLVRGGGTVSTLSGVEMSTGVGLAWGKSFSMHA